jgi:ABC-type dipeptide/oligopeptide/nickel transport system permease subunit
VIAVAVVLVPRFARIVRGSALQEQARDYVAAAEALGARTLRIVTVHLLPNCLAPLMVIATLSLATAILEISALSFLGLGVRPPTAEWGGMLNEGRRFYLSDPHVMIPPGVAIVLSVLAINLLGDGLRDALDPKMGEGEG